MLIILQKEKDKQLLTTLLVICNPNNLARVKVTIQVRRKAKIENYANPNRKNLSGQTTQ